MGSDAVDLLAEAMKRTDTEAGEVLVEALHELLHREYMQRVQDRPECPTLDMHPALLDLGAKS